MKVIDFEKTIKDYNKLSKKYNGIEYAKFVKEYIKYLKKKYKKRKETNYNYTSGSIYRFIKSSKNKLYKPSIVNSPFSHKLRNVKVEDVEYKIISNLGSGYFGKVYKVAIGDKIYALKEQKLDKPLWVDSYLNEIENMKKVNKIKPKIAPKYYKSWVYDNKGYILIEYINCGTLEDYVGNKTLSKKDYKELKKLIDVLHKHGLYHNDLHNENILVECKGKKKIRFYLNDFGISKTFKSVFDSNYEMIKSYRQSEKDFIKEELDIATTEEMLYDLIIDEIIVKKLLTLK